MRAETDSSASGSALANCATTSAQLQITEKKVADIKTCLRCKCDGRLSPAGVPIQPQENVVSNSFLVGRETNLCVRLVCSVQRERKLQGVCIES